jgi:type II secretory pathway predicted ATPase ExeA
MTVSLAVSRSRRAMNTLSRECCLELFPTVKLFHAPRPMGLMGQRLDPLARGMLLMYEQRFGLKRRPFPATPDSSLFYPATPHEAALAPMLRALGENEGLLLLTGAPGTGKTVLGQVLLERLEGEVASVFLTNSHLPDRAALLQALLFDMGLPYDDGAEQVLRLRLTDHVLKNFAAGKRTVAVIDEAQHLSADLLEELRLLGNLEAGQDKAFQVVCLAQEAMVERLNQPQLGAWKQRLAVHARLGPLSAAEACDYLLHHLRLAGGKPDKIMDESGLEVLARGTQGIPRLLNHAAHQALSLADAAEMDMVDAEAALEALAILGLQAEEPMDAAKQETPHRAPDDEDEEGEGETTAGFPLAGALRKSA